MRLRLGLAPLQSGDNDKQTTHDLLKIFARANQRKYAWIFGTEAGPGAGGTAQLLSTIGQEHGYRMYVPSLRKNAKGSATDAWVGVREDLIVSGWRTDYVPVIPGSGELYRAQGLNEDLEPRWGPKGLVTARFNSIPELGPVTLASSHHLTKGRDPKKSTFHGVNHYELNQKLDQAATDWFKQTAKGSAIGMYATDRNASDRGPEEIELLTSLADELGAWQNTGHGPIDWVMTYDRDKRVKAVKFTVLNDKRLFLYGDHFLSEGVVEVDSLAL